MAKPARPARRPWSSACWPSEADTCERDTSVRRTGSAPISRIFASSCAVTIVNEPVISAPVLPSIPSGYST